MARTIVQLSDVHIPAEGRLFGHVDCDARLAAALDAIVASDWRPEVLVLSGDLTDRGHPDSYRRLRPVVEAAARRLDAPVVYLPGNHDDVDVLERELLDREPTGRPLDQVAWIGSTRLIALDSTDRAGHHGTLEDAQLEWLAAELAAPAPEGSILVMHHPPVLSPLPIMADMQLREPERLAAVLAGSDVRMILCGHDHHASCGALAGVPVWLAPALAYTMDPLAAAGRVRGLPGGGCTLVELHAGGPVATAIPAPDGAEPVLDAEIAGMLAAYPKGP